MTIRPLQGEVFIDRRPYDVATESAKQAFHVYMFEQIAMGKSEAIERLLQGGVPVTITGAIHTLKLIGYTQFNNNIG